MSKALTTTAATIGLSLGPTFAANYHDYHAWSQPTVHDTASFRDHPVSPYLAVHVNYHPGHAGAVSFHGSSHRKH